METDSFFWQLFTDLPDTFFALLDLPPPKPGAYQYSSVELKNLRRVDGVVAPRSRRSPVYFVEVQHQLNPHFYDNLFAKVFCYRESKDQRQEWIAVAIFADRSVEPADLKPYQVLLDSRHVRRIYLDELPTTNQADAGLKILELLLVSKERAAELGSRMIKDAEMEGDCERSNLIVQLVEGALMRRFNELTREEVREMIKLHPLSESRAWQEIKEEAREEGREEKIREVVKTLLEKGKSNKEIAELLNLSLSEIRRFGRSR